MKISKRFWNWYAKTVYSILPHTFPYQKMMAKVVSLVQAQTNLTDILVPGCGQGGFEQALLKQSQNQALSIASVDFSAEMLASFKKSLNENFPDIDSTPQWHIDLVQADLTTDFKDALSKDCFDAAIVTNVLYALPNPESFITNLSQLIHPGGVVILIDPLPEPVIWDVLREHMTLLFSNQYSNNLRWKAIQILPKYVFTGFINALFITGNGNFLTKETHIKTFADFGFKVKHYSTVYGDTDHCFVFEKERDLVQPKSCAKHKGGE